MRILIVSATALEIKSFVSHPIEFGRPFPVPISNEHQTNFLITGIGAVPTAFHLAMFAKEYDFILNIGIAGSYNSKYGVGQVVAVKQDAFGDYGIDDNGVFVSLSNAGLMDKRFSISNDEISNSLYTNPSIVSVPWVDGITLGTASGSLNSINHQKKVWNPDIETMECAAVFYSCILLNKPFLCLRAISNMVEPRNKNSWKIQEALLNLHHEVLVLLGSIDTDDFFTFC